MRVLSPRKVALGHFRIHPQPKAGPRKDRQRRNPYNATGFHDWASNEGARSCARRRVQLSITEDVRKVAAPLFCTAFLEDNLCSRHLLSLFADAMNQKNLDAL